MRRVRGRIAASASLLYARNLFAFLETMVDKTTKQLSINREDELVKATMLTDAGKIVHPNFANAAPSPVMLAEAAPAKAVPAARKPAAAKKPAASKTVVPGKNNGDA
jgi:NAD(P) transhydrogenase subunit alpha